MTTKLFSLALIVSLFASPMSYALANSSTVFAQKLEALEKYVELLEIQLGSANYTRLSNAQMRTIIEDGSTWLRESQEESGHFAYEYMPYEDAYLDDDNIVRQAGALYALGEVARRSSSEDEETKRAMERAITFFERQSKKHEFEGTKMRCITNTEESSVCKLGATSLALIGILGYVEAYEEEKYDELIEEYLAYILASKKPEEGFRNEYKVGTGFKSEKESAFSNGEALLALVRYYQYSPNEEVKETIDATFTYLQELPFESALYLWIMAALKDMHLLWPSDAYVTYAKEFTLQRMGSLSASYGTQRNYCAATEGLVSAYSLLAKSATHQEKEKLRREIDLWNAKNSTLQINAEDIYKLTNENGGLLFKELKDRKQSFGGFLTAHDVLTQRIDFTQHCVTAYVQTLVDIDAQEL